MPSLECPEDESIRTLYVGGLDARVSEQDLRDNFYSHGEIKSVKMVLQRACAFVTYTTREAAEKAADELSNKLVIKGLRLKLMWGRPQAPRIDGEGVSDEARHGVAHGGLLPRAVVSHQQNQFQPPGTSAGQDQQPPPQMQYFNIPPPPPQQAFYPSMDPQRMGAVIRSQDGNGASGSGENRIGGSDQRLQYASHPPPPLPPHLSGGGQYYQQYYPPPPYGYGPPPPQAYQQYPPQSHQSAMRPPGPNAEQATQQKAPEVAAAEPQQQ